MLTTTVVRHVHEAQDAAEISMVSERARLQSPLHQGSSQSCRDLLAGEKSQQAQGMGLDPEKVFAFVWLPLTHKHPCSQCSVRLTFVYVPECEILAVSTLSHRPAAPTRVVLCPCSTVSQVTTMLTRGPAGTQAQAVRKPREEGPERLSPCCRCLEGEGLSSPAESNPNPVPVQAGGLHTAAAEGRQEGADNVNICQHTRAHLLTQSHTQAHTWAHTHTTYAPFPLSLFLWSIY